MIETKNVVITTATVEIKTVTVNNKQMTLSVYRQLPERELLRSDNSLAGNIWGHVKIHDKRCAYVCKNYHSIWEWDGYLYRSTVTNCRLIQLAADHRELLRKLSERAYAPRQPGDLNLSEEEITLHRSVMAIEHSVQLFIAA